MFSTQKSAAFCCLILFGLGFHGTAWLSAQSPPGTVGARGPEPAVYRVQSAQIGQIEEQLRNQFLNNPDFSVTVKRDDRPGVYRICVLASAEIQREIPSILQKHALLLPKEAGSSVVQIDAPAPAFPPQHPQQYHAANVLRNPYLKGSYNPPIPRPAVSSPTLPEPVLPPATPSSVYGVSGDHSRDSFTPSCVSTAKIEEMLRMLLGVRINNMTPGRYLIVSEKSGVRKHCTLDVDQVNNRLLLIGDKALCDQTITLIDAIDRPEPQQGRERRFVSIANIRPEAVNRIMEIGRATPNLQANSQTPHPTNFYGPAPQHPASTELRNPEEHRNSPQFRAPKTPTTPDRMEFRNGSAPLRPAPLPLTQNAPSEKPRHLDPRRNPVIQLVGYRFQDGEFGFSGSEPAPLGGGNGQVQPGQSGAAGTGMEVVSDFRYQILPDLDVLIIDATGAEVARFTDMIRQIEELSRIADPKIEVYFLKHVNCVSLNWVIFQVYVDLFRTKQGTVKVIPMIHPNAMLLIGWGNSLEAMKDLIETLDKPVAAENNMMKVFRLNHAGAQYVLTVLRGAFPMPSAQNSAFAPRIQMSADTRTNSIIVQAGPNDLAEIESIIQKVDVPGAGPKLQVKAFKLKHTLAGDLAQVLTDAITPGVSGTSDRKLPALEMLVMSEEGERMIKSGIMADVRISRDVRQNTVIVTGPEQCMELIGELIKMLDTPAATAEIKVFQILYGDANSMIKTLQSLIPSQLEGQVGPQLPGAKDEDSLVPVRFAVDTRTNSILAAGAPNDLKIVEALLYSLDREDRQTRTQTVYMLKSMQAKDVSVAINEYLRSKRLIQQGAPGVVSPYQQIESEVVVIPEHVSNSLIVSATPRYYDEIMELIREIDKSPPQVVIQVLIGEVTLSNTDEFGAEFGIQDSLLFGRSNVNSTTNTVSPGWLFNESPSSSLGNSSSADALATAGNVGSQLLTNFATGRVSSETGFGGVVFSANSDAVSIMIRALQETGRLEVLSRPQIMAMNNQKAAIHVGQMVPRIQGTKTTSYGETMDVKDAEVGLMLMVTPSISPEGNIVMMVAAQKSKIGSSNEGVVVGYSNNNPVTSPIIDRIHTVTMVSAADHETVVLGGLITKDNQKLHRKVPLLGDIPVLGKLFSYEYNRCKRSELLIILTPRIVRDSCDMEQIKRMETARMSWCLSGVSRLHGDIGAYNVAGEIPYAGDAEVYFPEAVDMGGLTPIEMQVDKTDKPNKTDKKSDSAPKLAPKAPPETPKMPVPTLPKKTEN